VVSAASVQLGSLGLSCNDLVELVVMIWCRSFGSLEFLWLWLLWSTPVSSL